LNKARPTEVTGATQKLACSVLLFDFGETLARVWPYHEWLYVRACREFGVEVDPRVVASGQDAGWGPYETPDGPAHPQISMSGAQFLRYKTEVIAERLRQMGIAGPLEAIAARIYELDTQPEMYRVYDDAIPTLTALSERGYRMAIISNHEWELAELVNGLGLGRFFQAIITSARAGYRKPHARIFTATLDAMDASPQDALMIGDGLAPDVEGATKLGMKAVLLDRSARQVGVAPENSVIPNLTSLLDFL